MDHHVETLLSQADHLLAQLKQAGGDDPSTAKTEISVPHGELRRVALELVQINTNSLSRARRERINSVLITSAPFILEPEDIGIIQELERQRAKLTKELARASTRAARRQPTKSLRRLEEQQMLFLRGVLKDHQKTHAKLKRDCKKYIRATRALGIATQENARNDTISITDRWQAEILRNQHARKRLR